MRSKQSLNVFGYFMHMTATGFLKNNATALSQSNDLHIAVFNNEIPGFVEKEIERLYESVYSSLNKCTCYGRIKNVNTYVVTKNNQVISLFLFTCSYGHLKVLNEVIQIEEEEISRFAHYIFATLNEVRVITFNAIDTKLGHLHYPYQSSHYLEDIVVHLPSSSDAYLSSLGSATRKTIRKYKRKVELEFESFHLETFVRDEIDDSIVREILKLKCARMANKKSAFTLPNGQIEKTIKLAKACGLVSVLLIDGKICAGSICYQVGKHYFMEVSTHDPTYNDYRLGTLCCYLTIRSCIERAGKQCHLLWGRSSYKFNFLGVLHHLDKVTIYRSRFHTILYGHIYLSTTAGKIFRHMKTWMGRIIHKAKTAIALRQTQDTTRSRHT
jgi:hypothetical protein